MHTTNNKAVVTHIWPKSRSLGLPDEPRQKAISDEREGDVWYELRELTFEQEPGCILVATHEVQRDGDNQFTKTFEKDEVLAGRLRFPDRKKLTTLVTKEGLKRTKEELLPWSLGIRQCADEVIARYKPHYGSDEEPLLALVLVDPQDWCHLKYLDKVVNECPGLPIYIFHTPQPDKYGVEREAGRKEDYTFSTLPEDEEEDALQHLLAKFALTMMPAPSYTGKTHLSISMGLSLVTGDAWLGQFKVPEKMRVRVFVPELSAGRYKKFMLRIAPSEVWKQHEEDFIVRPLDCDLLMLDSQAMIEKCRGCYVFLDTLGYFMGMDDNNSYAAAIEFAKRINHLIKEGCLGVCGLYHPPKYSKLKKETGNILTLENQILGSAGFGGLLRSCIAIRNLNQDANDGLWCYVQGLKNPGLGKPFQVKGFPMEYLGESPYLSELLGTNGTKKDQVKAMLSEGKTSREICKTLGVSPKTVVTCNEELKLFAELPTNEVFQNEEGEE
jgi:hypothetical protein